MTRFSFLLFIILFTKYTALCQPSYPPPTGVYCSCGPTLGTGNGSVDPAIAAKSFVKGILVRVPWELLEPSDNSYNWSLIDGQITAAKSFNKKISLGIGSGGSVPQWVFTAGAQYLITTTPVNDSIAVPWDNIFLSKWTEFIAALGTRYQNDTTITLVYITNSTANGFEMQMPFSSTPSLSAAGYTNTKMTQSWKTVIDAFDVAFPNHYLSNDFHPVNGSDDVADSVYDYAINKMSNRYGANAWWWTQKNTTLYPAQYDIVKHSVANNVFTGVQFANNGTNDSAKFGPGGMPVALQLAISDGICYWEIWNQDINNMNYDSLFTYSGCDTPTSVQYISNPSFEIYPNPTTDELNIKLPRTLQEGDIFTFSLVDIMGMEVFRSDYTPSGEYILKYQLPQLTTGFYTGQIVFNNQRTTTRVFIQ